MAQVAIVGAGMGGLCTAVALAARGVPVRVYEMTGGPGGKIAVDRHEGVEFDVGPTVLTMPDAVDRVFRAAHTALSDEVQVFQPDPFFRYEWPDGAQVHVHPEPERTVEAIGSAFGSEAAREMEEFLAYARRLWSATSQGSVYGPAPGPAKGLSGLLQMARSDPFRTAWTGMRKRVKEPHLRDILTRFATYEGADPRRAPAALNSVAHVELGMGGYGVRGGMFELVRALVRVAERLGVEFEYGTRISRIREHEGVVDGIETRDGRMIRVPAAVVNCEETALYGTLLARRSETGDVEPSPSAWTAVVRARRRRDARRRPAHAVLFPSRPYLDEIEDIFDRREAPREPAIYACAQEAAHQRRGWGEQEPVSFMVSAPPEPPGGSEQDVWDELRRSTLRRLRAADWVDDDDEIVFERAPGDFAARYPGSRGGLYGPASHGRVAALRRLPNRIPKVERLYAASGSAHPGPGVSLCALSGLAAAAEVLRDLDLALPAR